MKQEPFTVFPRLSYELLGTHLQLEAGKPHRAVHATNQPQWEERGLVFAYPNNDSDGEYGILISSEEYTTATTADDGHRDRIITALETYARQRPRLEFGNYGDPVAYRAEMRGLTRDLWHVRQLLQAAKLCNVTEAHLHEALGGRLTWDGSKLDYVTGQYWPTEYRPAICRALASALFYHFRDAGNTTREAILEAAQKVLPRSVVARWLK